LVAQSTKRLQHLLAHGVLAAFEVRAAVVSRRGRQSLAGIERATFVNHAQYDRVVTAVLERGYEALARFVKREPVVEDAARRRIEHLGRREVFVQKRPVEIGGQRASRDDAWRNGESRRLAGSRAHRDLC